MRTIVPDEEGGFPGVGTGAGGWRDEVVGVEGGKW